jgi:hypothetical protein
MDDGREIETALNARCGIGSCIAADQQDLGARKAEAQ